MNSFIHLHLHSEFSLLDSNLKIPGLIKKAQDLNMPAIAMTDHGNILGAVNFYKNAVKNGVRPIIGSELYIAEHSRFSKPDKKKGEINYHHLVALVKNKQGYRNLCELITEAYLKGFYRKPRIDKEILEKYKDGLIIMSACIQGEIPYNLLHNKEEKAYESAKWYREVFKDDYYIEMQDHGLSEQIEVIPKLQQLSSDLSIPLVATNDVHYLEKEDSDAREILICLQTGNVLSDPNRPMKKQTSEMYLKSTEEMKELFADIPESLSTSFDIASKCHFDFKLGVLSLPTFSVPEAFTIDGYFEKICREGFETIRESLQNRRYKIEVYETRLDYEIDKIREMGFPGYFLIVWDIIKFSKDNGIPVGPGRGSVVGSLVAFVMGITNVDPLEYDLIFERFLNPERISMPDIDLDFETERRSEVIEYIRNKYGKENTAQIVTFGKMKAKMAIRDIGRVLELPLSDVNKIAKMIQDGPRVELKKEIDTNSELREAIKLKPERKKLIEFALKLENNVRHTSMHAAAVVIAPKKMTEFMPLYKTKDDIVTQFEKDEVEEVGLLKMDILGLTTLTIIKNILDEIYDIEKKKIDLDTIPLNDEKTFQIFQTGNTGGIFQFESSGMRELLKNSKPERIEDLIALNALYRPGPLNSGMADSYVKRKLGKEKVIYAFAELEPILKDTYGVIVYQEQVMQISVTLAGFSLGKADEMRKVMGKKLEQKLPALETAFVSGAVKKGFNKKKAEKLFSQMKEFAQYGFNKSHSTAYAFIAYQTAYLKAHYPVYFMSAHLTTESSKTSKDSKIIQYISESKKMGIDILPPDINKSTEHFSADNLSAIRFGLKGLKNVGDAALKSIIHSRDKDGPFKTYDDFVTRIELSKVNKAVLESLIKSGSLDRFNLKRSTMFSSVEDTISQAGIIDKNKKSAQRSLFTGENSLNKIVIKKDYLGMDEWNEQEIIKGEKEITGIYISQHPLDRYVKEIKKLSNTSISELIDFKGKSVKLIGVITAFTQKKSKKGTFYGNLFFEDLTGRVPILVFNNSRKSWHNRNGNNHETKVTWDDIKQDLEVDTPYYIEGQVPDNDSNSVDLYLSKITKLDDFINKEAKKIFIKIDYSFLKNEVTGEYLDKILTEYKGKTPYQIIIIDKVKKYKIIIENDEDGLRANKDVIKLLKKTEGIISVEAVY